MEPTVLPLHDETRDRPLATVVYVPASGASSPLIVFAHGMWGHPRRFDRLFTRWAGAGYVVAAPTFPHTSGENAPPDLAKDVANQPADVSLVLDELLARGLGDGDRVGVGGFSLGAETALRVGLHPADADSRVRAVAALGGGLHPDVTVDALRPLPLLLVQGAEDKEYRRQEALRVYEAAHEPKELVLLTGGRHGICQDDDEPRHAMRVADITTAFWDRHLRE